VYELIQPKVPIKNMAGERHLAFESLFVGRCFDTSCAAP
jgi:hypothetical protein